MEGARQFWRAEILPLLKSTSTVREQTQVPNKDGSRVGNEKGEKGEKGIKAAAGLDIVQKGLEV